VLDVLTFRVGRGIAMATGGNFVGEGLADVDGNPMSDASEPSRRIFGSGRDASWEVRGVRASGASSVDDEGERTVVFDLRRLGTFGAAGKTIALGFILTSGAGIGGEAAETDLVDLLDARRDRVVDKDETEGDERSVLLPEGRAVAGVLGPFEVLSEMAEVDLAGEGSLGRGGMGRLGALRLGVCGDGAEAVFGVALVVDLFVMVVRLAIDGAIEGALLAVDGVRAPDPVAPFAGAMPVLTRRADLAAVAALLAPAGNAGFAEVWALLLMVATLDRTELVVDAEVVLCLSADTPKRSLALPSGFGGPEMDRPLGSGGTCPGVDREPAA